MTILSTDLRRLGETLERVVPETMAEHGVPGTAIGVLREDDELIRCFGVTDVEHPEAVDPDTLFQAGSITKTVTATLVAQLVESGRLDLDRPVRAYLPDLPLADAAARAGVTGRQLLAHLGGWEGDFFVDTGADDDALARYVAALGAAPQLVPFDRLHSYSNSGYSLLGRVVEALRDLPFEDAAARSVLGPLGLERTGFAHRVPAGAVASGHVVHRGSARVVRPWTQLRSASPAGGLVTSVRELLAYARFHLGRSGTDVLAPAALARMRVPPFPAAKSANAVPWEVGRLGALQLLSHGGSTVSQISTLVIAPEAGLAIVVLSNADRGLSLLPAIQGAVRDWLGVERPAPPRAIAVPPERLAGYAGRYRAAIYTVDVTVEGGSAVLDARRVGGLDAHQRPRPEPLPPSRLEFFDDDRGRLRDGPFAGMPVWFAREADGRVRWVKFYGRLTPREA